jgi:hypothetical protein
LARRDSCLADASRSEQIELGAATHLALDEFEFGDLTLDLSV